MHQQLAAVAETQGRWSSTASSLKASYERTRLIVFGLSITAALLAAVSSQQPDGIVRMSLAIGSTVCLAIVTLLTARFLGARNTSAWVRARAASEALKREGYKSAAQAAPYDDPVTRDAMLRDEVRKIENDLDDLMGLQLPKGSSSIPTDLISPQHYIDKRVTGQIDYYRRAAAKAQAAATQLRRVEFALAVITTVITAALGLVKKDTFGDFDVVALTAVLTTLSGTIVAYIEASRYDFIVTTYRATARRLEDERNNLPQNAQNASKESSDFVNRCETILAAENSGWIAKFGR